MDANGQFFYRFSQLSVVKAVTAKGISTYEMVKNSNRLFNVTFQLAENSAKYAIKVVGASSILDFQVVATVNKVLTIGLDKLCERCPFVKKTPEELWAVGKDYYENSYFKNIIEKLYAGAGQIIGIYKCCKNLVAVTLSRLLSLLESVVDNYIAIQVNQNAQVNQNGQPPQINADNYGRVRRIFDKVYCRVKRCCMTTIQYPFKTLDDLRVAALLILFCFHWEAVGLAGNILALSRQMQSAFVAIATIQSQIATVQSQVASLTEELASLREETAANVVGLREELMAALREEMAALREEIREANDPAANSVDA